MARVAQERGGRRRPGTPSPAGLLSPLGDSGKPGRPPRTCRRTCQHRPSRPAPARRRPGRTPCLCARPQDTLEEVCSSWLCSRVPPCDRAAPPHTSVFALAPARAPVASGPTLGPVGARSRSLSLSWVTFSLVRSPSASFCQSSSAAAGTGRGEPLQRSWVPGKRRVGGRPCHCAPCSEGQSRKGGRRRRAGAGTT